ncbi:MAG TPA: O-antigen ligase family protein [Burkholderiaceae bacterium]|nr:O-antigen ligase family protein [Burkholderiaceae bacterium]
MPDSALFRLSHVFSSPANARAALPSIGVFLCAAMLVALPGGGAWSVVALAVCLAAAPAQAKPDPRLRDEIWIALIVTTAIIAMVAFNRWWHAAPWRELQNPLRWWLLPLLMLLLARVRLPSAHAFAAGAAVGALGAAGLGMYERVVIDLPRAGGFANQILYGNLALTLGVMCGVAWLVLPRGRALALVGLAGGLLASLLSGSRGGWIAVPILAVVLAVLSPDRRVRRGLWGVVVIALIAAAVAWWLALIGHFPRLQQAVVDLQAYAAGNSDSSLGVRLEMWRAAWRFWREAPWMGMGTGNFHAGLERLVASGQMPAHVLQYRHAHNEFLHALATTGVVGLTALLALSAIPLSRMWRVSRALEARTELRFYALCGVCLIVGFWVYGLTQAMFQHNLGIIGFIVLLAICWRGIRP